MATIRDFNPLKSIAVPNVGRIEPKGLVLVIGPNSAEKTQFLRDIQSRMLGQDRNLVVCDDIEIIRPSDLDPFLEVLLAEKHIQRRVDERNRVYFEPKIPDFGRSNSKWSYQESVVRHFFSVDSGQTNAGGNKYMILDLFGRSFISSLFLDRRLTVTNTVESFDYETESPLNELHALYIDSVSKELQTYPVYHDLVALLHKCRIHGLFLVPVGELEDWVPLLTNDGPSRKRKAEWANFAANRIRESPTSNEDIWEFVRQMACFQRDERSRLAGYPTRVSKDF
jgi:hypothetical protein